MHATEEHADIEETMRVVENSERFNEDWIDKVKKLEELVKHHVKEEEGNVSSNSGGIKIQRVVKKHYFFILGFKEGMGILLF